MSLSDFLAALSCDNSNLQFSDTLALIDSLYHFTPTYFKNGEQENLADQNNGSCKCFAFARLHGLDQSQTLRLFAEHYRQVQATPEGPDHQNIRQFMRLGWPGIDYGGVALTAKAG